MSKLESLVPPLELCKLIPAGEFEDSALVQRVPNSSFPLEDEFYEIHERDKCESWMKDKQIPAPTLEEIIRKIRFDLLCGIEHHGDFYVANRHIGRFEDERAATSALKLWLKLKGL